MIDIYNIVGEEIMEIEDYLKSRYSNVEFNIERRDVLDYKGNPNIKVQINIQHQHMSYFEANVMYSKIISRESCLIGLPSISAWIMDGYDSDNYKIHIRNIIHGRFRKMLEALNILEHAEPEKPDVVGNNEYSRIVDQINYDNDLILLI